MKPIHELPEWAMFSLALYIVVVGPIAFLQLAAYWVGWVWSAVAVVGGFIALYAAGCLSAWWATARQR